MNCIAATLDAATGTSASNYVGGDPKFRNAALRNFALRPSSPCIGAGDNFYWDGIENPLDILGNSRVLMHTVDQGAIEAEPQRRTLLQLQ